MNQRIFFSSFFSSVDSKILSHTDCSFFHCLLAKLSMYVTPMETLFPSETRELAFTTPPFKRSYPEEVWEKKRFPFTPPVVHTSYPEEDWKKKKIIHLHSRVFLNFSSGLGPRYTFRAIITLICRHLSVRPIIHHNA